MPEASMPSHGESPYGLQSPPPGGFPLPPGGGAPPGGYGPPPPGGFGPPPPGGFGPPPPGGFGPPPPGGYPPPPPDPYGQQSYGAGGPPPPLPPGPRKASGAWYLWGALVGLALALLLLLVFYKFFYPELSREAQLAMIDPGVLQQSNIDALQAEIDAYRAALDGDVCLAPPLADAAPLFRPRALALPEGGAAGDDGTDGGGGGAPPPNLPPPLNPDAGDNIESATVLVIASGDESAGAGTGFFINDRQLLTNRHVVADALGSRNGVVLITSKSLGRVVRVEIKSVTPANEVGRDYAVLEVSEPVNHAKLALQPQAQRQERVGAWGYPSLNTEMDPQMQALLEGDATSAPEIIYSEGVISVVQRGTGGPSIISHTADVSHGNSGGPLVNAAGDVIGINTQIRADEKSNRQVNMSLASDDIIRFLGENGISYDLARNPA